MFCYFFLTSPINSIVKTFRIDSNNGKTFTIKNRRAWIFLFALGNTGANGLYDIFLYTPSYSGEAVVRKVTNNGDLQLSASISGSNVVFSASSMYLQGLALYAS